MLVFIVVADKRPLLIYFLILFFMQKVISFLRGPILFVFNFHPTKSYERYSIGVGEAGEYQVRDAYPCLLSLVFNVRIYHFCFICSLVLIKL